MARPSPGVGVTVFEKWQCTGYQKCITHGGTVVNSDLLPLCPASLMHKKCQRHKIIHGKHPMGHKGQCNGCKSLCRISCSYDFCGCSCGCCLTRYISFSLCCALRWKEFFIPVNCNTEFWSVSSDK